MSIDKLSNLKQLLIQIGQLSKHHEKIARITGNNFNIFRTLKVEVNEVKTHSAFIAELLNTMGSHGQGDLYLKLFMKQFEITNFTTVNAKICIEKDIGPINSAYTRGGRIDIAILDENNNQIFIENKIYAGDQHKQLLRYYNADRNAKLFYLTLFGTVPSEDSTGGLDANKHINISYKEDILNWLGKCKKESTDLPIIRETVTQYINLIKHLTNQTEIEAMSAEIKNIILDNPELIEPLNSAFTAWCDIIKEVEEKFKKKMSEHISYKNKSEKDKIGDISIFVSWAEDKDGVFIQYCIMKSEEDIINDTEVKEIIISVIGRKSGWYNPIGFVRYTQFRNLEPETIISFYKDDSKLADFVNLIIQEEKRKRESLIENLKQLGYSSV